MKFENIIGDLLESVVGGAHGKGAEAASAVAAAPAAAAVPAASDTLSRVDAAHQLKACGISAFNSGLAAAKGAAMGPEQQIGAAIDACNVGVAGMKK